MTPAELDDLYVRTYRETGFRIGFSHRAAIAACVDAAMAQEREAIARQLEAQVNDWAHGRTARHALADAAEWVRARGTR